MFPGEGANISGAVHQRVNKRGEGMSDITDKEYMDFLRNHIKLWAIAYGKLDKNFIKLKKKYLKLNNKFKEYKKGKEK